MIDSFIKGNKSISGANGAGASFMGKGTLGPAPSPNSCGPLVQFTGIVGAPPPVPAEIRPDLIQPGGENDVKGR